MYMQVTYVHLANDTRLCDWHTHVYNVSHHITACMREYSACICIVSVMCACVEVHVCTCICSSTHVGLMRAFKLPVNGIVTNVGHLPYPLRELSFVLRTSHGC